MRFVAVKTEAQQARGMLFRTRETQINGIVEKLTRHFE